VVVAVLALAGSAALSGCGGRSSPLGGDDGGPGNDTFPRTDGGGDGGGGDGGFTDVASDTAVDTGGGCNGLDEPACNADPACRYATCPACPGQGVFGGCIGADEPGPQCPALPCVDCSSVGDQTSCNSSGQCKWVACSDGTAGCYDPDAVPDCIEPSCQGLDEFSCKRTPGCEPQRCCGTFSYCDVEGALGACPAVVCTDCAGIGSEEECRASADCHAVYQQADGCNCDTVGCCQEFAYCASGDRPRCVDPGVACAAASPLCGGDFTVGYSDFCYEGCVRADECAMPPTNDCTAGGCAPGSSCQGCLGANGVEYVCIPEGAAC
jgi:hypothetical protein